MQHGKRSHADHNLNRGHMAHFHLNATPFIEKITDSNSAIVEIGSDRDEGSTAFFDSIAKSKQQEFYSVDVVDVAQKKFTHLQNTNWVICEAGSKWAKEDLPKLQTKIGVLYLDNYDWGNYPIGENEKRIIEDYKKRGLEWSTFESQREHLEQMMYCLPYMAEQSVVICDDTPFIGHAGIYFGKCGAVIPYLAIHGYKIVYSGNNGCILAKGI
jgi:hypothetical protein